MIKRFLLLFLVVSVTLQAQKWQKVVESKLKSIFDVHFITETKGFAVGSSGTIYYTSDGGSTWEQKTSSYKSTLYTVYFVNEKNGYAGGRSEQFLRTTDGGNTWQLDTLKGADGTITGFWFADTAKGFALVSKSTGGQIYKTTDAGKTWTKQLQAKKDLLAFDFRSENIGVATGKYTTDVYYMENGTEWKKSTVGNLGSYNYTRSDLKTVKFINATTAYASGWGSDAAGLQPTIHLKTIDGGKNWTYMDQSVENRTYVNIYEIYFKDDKNGIAVGGSASDGSVILKTTDGGKNWIKININSGVIIKDLFVKNNKTWFIGSGSSVFTSDTNWNNFKMISKLPSVYLYSISVKGNKIIAGGFYGMELKSDDNGVNWKASFTGVNGKCTKINNLYFVDENLGFAAKSRGQLIKTENGGGTWTELIAPNNSIFAVYNDVFFYDKLTGFVVGRDKNKNSIISSTTDGGKTWKDTTSVFKNELNTVYFATKLSGVVAGSKMSLGYTEDGGKTWNQSKINNLPSSSKYSSIEDVQFLNSNFGIAVGKKTVLKTTDGGKNWDYVKIPKITVTLRGVQIIDQNVWVTAGSKKIYKTVDGGISWENIETSEIDQNIYSLSFDKNKTLWACGGNSTIYKFVNFTSVDEFENKIPTSLKLSQNYPNPFNPVTVIEFSVAKESKVKIEVFNILGEKVKTIYNNYTQPGNYKVQFDSTNDSGNKIPSGVYFYRISTPEKSITKKMIYLK